LVDAEKWTQFRRNLQDQVDVARKFQTKYSDLDWEDEADDNALDDLEKTIDSFAENVSKRITQLDKISQSLIEIVSMLTTPAYHTSLSYAVQRNQSADMSIGI
jgi:chromosome segregation ATPase